MQHFVPKLAPNIWLQPRVAFAAVPERWCRHKVPKHNKLLLGIQFAERLDRIMDDLTLDHADFSYTSADTRCFHDPSWNSTLGNCAGRSNLWRRRMREFGGSSMHPGAQSSARASGSIRFSSRFCPNTRCRSNAR